MFTVVLCCFFFFFKQKTAYEMLRSLVGSEMCIRDRYQRRVRGKMTFGHAFVLTALLVAIGSTVPITQDLSTQLDCSFGDTSVFDMSLLNNCTKGAIKIRTCRTELGCTGDSGKWNSFKDCPLYVTSHQEVDLKFEQKVVYLYLYLSLIHI
eukprot:TRINITY_DN14218_c0_g1_i10.p2 TRINITY_DN14218_c0_g1~~TRINITY_DN14218_c0_g1_i10.p2  ORF type:complete len:151 (-),score=58.28 TRINITY_DN14218_c0_g1_i10:159-611(-)